MNRTNTKTDNKNKIFFLDDDHEDARAFADTSTPHNQAIVVSVCKQRGSR